MKRITAILAIVIALFSLTHAQATVTTMEMTCTVPKGEILYIRNRKSTEATHLGFLSHGDLVQVEENENGWIKFTHENKEAYAVASFFEVTDGQEYTIEANGRVRYRDKANGTMLGFYAVGTKVVVDAWLTDKDGQEWGRIGDHYVMKEFLK